MEKKYAELVTNNTRVEPLPRSTPEAEKVSAEAIGQYLDAVERCGQDLHSLMIVRHGKVVFETWLGEHAADELHGMYSVSKSFTSAAVGFAVTEGRLKVTDHVISFFPEELPEDVSPYLESLQVKHLLTMSVGQEEDPMHELRETASPWEAFFLSIPVKHEPGTRFLYNSAATYMLSAIVQRLTGQTLLEYLEPRLFRPLAITRAQWLTSPSGVNAGGWGLKLTTEDMAKMGQFMLQKGRWKDEQLLPESWFDEATRAYLAQPPSWVGEEADPSESDWYQGYGYQLWRCRHNAYRADGHSGQFIIVLPEKDAVIVTTANIADMQAEINLIWDHLLPAMG